MQAYPSRGYQEQHYYNKEKIIEEEHVYKDEHHYSNGATMLMKPNQYYYPQPKRDQVHKLGYGGHDGLNNYSHHGYGGHNVLNKHGHGYEGHDGLNKHGHDYHNGNKQSHETYYEEEHHETWNEYSGHNGNKQHMNKYTSGVNPYGSGNYGQALNHNRIEHGRPNYGYECEPQKGRSVWNFKGIMD